MAISTDATLPDYLAATSETFAETRSLTSGSGGNTFGSMETIKEREANGNGSLHLETEIASGEEVSFQVTKEGSRKIAALTSDQEYNSLLDKHQALVRKRFSEGGLTKTDALQLRLIRWMLDSVEVARLSPDTLDPLEQLTKAQEAIAAKVIQTAERLGAILDAESAANKRSYKRTA